MKKNTDNVQLLVVDFGSQFSLVIPRMCNELGVRAALLSPEKAVAWLKEHRPKGIILSGGDRSVLDADSPKLPKEVLDEKVPILAICYGAQLITKHFGGMIAAEPTYAQHGPTLISVNRSDPLFEDTYQEQQAVYMSHDDSIISPPEGAKVLARPLDHLDNISAYSLPEHRIWAVIFHPEVTHTEKGRQMFDNFMKLCGCEADWNPADIVGEIGEEFASLLLPGEKVIAGFSGGVDSTTLCAILAPVLGERLYPLVLDVGLLRYGELDEIRKNASHAKVSLRVTEDFERQEFLRHMQFGGILGSDEKRTRFKEAYATHLQNHAVQFGATVLAQGSLAPDFIESGATGGASIKGHHNVDLKTNLRQLHPFRNLFKYEVRAIAKSLGLPAEVYARKPFPGPGQFLRLLGLPITDPNLDTLNACEHIVRTILQVNGQMDNIDQLVVALAGLEITGVKGDKRSRGFPVYVRAIKSTDFMTAQGYHIPYELQDEINRAVSKIPGVIGAGFFTNSKPPQTIEFA